MYQVEVAENEDLKQTLYQVVYQVAYQVKDFDIDLLVRTFRMLQEPISKTELMKSVGIANRNRFKRVCLDILIQAGVATPTIPDKPNSRLQKYVLTEKGRKLLK